MKKLTNSEAKLKKTVVYKKKHVVTHLKARVTGNLTFSIDHTIFFSKTLIEQCQALKHFMNPHWYSYGVLLKRMKVYCI